MDDDYSVLVGKHRYRDAEEDSENILYMVQREEGDLGMFTTLENAGFAVDTYLDEGQGREDVVNAPDVDVDVLSAPFMDKEYEVEGVTDEEYDQILEEAGL
jgi:hypothetical protein